MRAVIGVVAIIAIAAWTMPSPANERGEFPGRRTGGGTRIVIVENTNGSPPDQFPGGTSGGGGR